jgi:hypothetical protein
MTRDFGKKGFFHQKRNDTDLACLVLPGFDKTKLIRVTATSVESQIEIIVVF